uniref:Retrotransposon gag domain-containing protein n=1 Tax=Tanacetum cinerariifolium TaxID=118510 RepID=A0A699IIF7_TANCI|nr:hypothetical protein [Tanacetum cinerariifolium]
MRTRSSSNLVGESSPNPTSSNPKLRNRRRSKQPFILEESPVDTIVDERTMAELLRALTEGYAEAIVVPPILAEHFELKHSRIIMMTSNQFFGLEKDNPHDHIRAARRWLEKEPPRSILTWEDLVSKFINEFFPPSRTTNLRNEIFNFQQRFDESFHEAWDRYKDLLHSLNSATDGNLLERRTQDVLTIIENKSKDNIQGYVSAPALNYNQDNFSYRPSSVANQIRSPGFAQPNVQNNQNRFSQPQRFNRGNNFNQDASYQAPIQQNQVVPLSELEKIKKINEINIKAMQTQINNVENELRNEMKTSIQASMSNQTNELKNMMASFFQINIASTSGSGPLPSNTIANPKEETLTDSDLAEYTIKVPPPLVQKAKPHSQRNYVKILTSLLSNKEKLLELANTPLNENCLAVILKKLPEKLGDPRKFLIPCGFSELKCKALADLAGIARDVFVPVGKFTFLADFEVINPLSGNPTSSSPDHLLEEFADELAPIIFPLRNNDLMFDIESDHREIEYFLNHDPTKEMDSILKDSIDESNLADPNNNLVDTIPEMFTDEHTLDYSSPPLYDDLDDDPIELKSDNDNVYDDPFDSKEDKIKESKLLIDELDPPRSNDFLPSLEYGSFLFEDFFKVEALPLTNNKDKVFVRNT